jgi:hypothetical protein
MWLSSAGAFRDSTSTFFEAAAFFLFTAVRLRATIGVRAWLVKAVGVGVCAWLVEDNSIGWYTGPECLASTVSISEVTGLLNVPRITNFPAAMAACSWWWRSPGRIGSPLGVTNGPVSWAVVLPWTSVGSTLRRLERSYALRLSLTSFSIRRILASSTASRFLFLAARTSALRAFCASIPLDERFVLVELSSLSRG